MKQEIESLCYCVSLAFGLDNSLGARFRPGLSPLLPPLRGAPPEGRRRANLQDQLRRVRQAVSVEKEISLFNLFDFSIQYKNIH